MKGDCLTDGSELCEELELGQSGVRAECGEQCVFEGLLSFGEEPRSVEVVQQDELGSVSKAGKGGIRRDGGEAKMTQWNIPTIEFDGGQSLHSNRMPALRL